MLQPFGREHTNSVGAGDGAVLGEPVGAADVGSSDGASLGVPVGAMLVGAADGAPLGMAVGVRLGVSLGASVTGVLVDRVVGDIDGMLLEFCTASTAAYAVFWAFARADLRVRNEDPMLEGSGRGASA